MIQFHLVAKELIACLLIGFCMQAHAASEEQMERSRGELLYSTHCIACHTEQVHWRDKRLATNWEQLKHQVRRWEDNTNLYWSEEDIDAVSRYLNALYYHFPIDSEGGGDVAHGGAAR
ncbi:MAG: cytochrome C [Burkholderiaceae bacterium]